MKNGQQQRIHEPQRFCCRELHWAPLGPDPAGARRTPGTDPAKIVSITYIYSKFTSKFNYSNYNYKY
jgi:hypothetical protein